MAWVLHCITVLGFFIHCSCVTIHHMTPPQDDLSVCVNPSYAKTAAGIVKPRVQIKALLYRPPARRPEDSVKRSSRASAGVDLQKKIIVIIKFTNRGKTSSEEEYIVVDHVTDQRTKATYRLLNPLVFKAKQHQIKQMYPLRAVRSVNWDPWEEVINKNTKKYRGCSTDVTHATCGVQYDSNQQLIEFSEGFCCSCDAYVNMNRQPADFSPEYIHLPVDPYERFKRDADSKDSADLNAFRRQSRRESALNEEDQEDLKSRIMSLWTRRTILDLKSSNKKSDPKFSQVRRKKEIGKYFDKAQKMFESIKSKTMQQLSNLSNLFDGTPRTNAKMADSPKRYHSIPNYITIPGFETAYGFTSNDTIRLNTLVDPWESTLGRGTSHSQDDDRNRHFFHALGELQNGRVNISLDLSPRENLCGSTENNFTNEIQTNRHTVVKLKSQQLSTTQKLITWRNSNGSTEKSSSSSDITTTKEKAFEEFQRYRPNTTLELDTLNNLNDSIENILKTSDTLISKRLALKEFQNDRLTITQNPYAVGTSSTAMNLFLKPPLQLLITGTSDLHSLQSNRFTITTERSRDISSNTPDKDSSSEIKGKPSIPNIPSLHSDARLSNPQEWKTSEISNSLSKITANPMETLQSCPNATGNDLIFLKNPREMNDKLHILENLQCAPSNLACESATQIVSSLFNVSNVITKSCFKRSITDPCDIIDVEGETKTSPCSFAEDHSISTSYFTHSLPSKDSSSLANKCSSSYCPTLFSKSYSISFEDLGTINESVINSSSSELDGTLTDSSLLNAVNNSSSEIKTPLTKYSPNSFVVHVCPKPASTVSILDPKLFHADEKTDIKASSKPEKSSTVKNQTTNSVTIKNKDVAVSSRKEENVTTTSWRKEKVTLKSITNIIDIINMNIQTTTKETNRIMMNNVKEITDNYTKNSTKDTSKNQAMKSHKTRTSTSENNKTDLLDIIDTITLKNVVKNPTSDIASLNKVDNITQNLISKGKETNPNNADPTIIQNAKGNTREKNIDVTVNRTLNKFGNVSGDTRINNNLSKQASNQTVRESPVMLGRIESRTAINTDLYTPTNRIANRFEQAERETPMTPGRIESRTAINIDLYTTTNRITNRFEQAERETPMTPGRIESRTAISTDLYTTTNRIANRFEQAERETPMTPGRIESRTAINTDLYTTTNRIANRFEQAERETSMTPGRIESRTAINTDLYTTTNRITNRFEQAERETPMTPARIESRTAINTYLYTTTNRIANRFEEAEREIPVTSGRIESRTAINTVLYTTTNRIANRFEDLFKNTVKNISTIRPEVVRKKANSTHAEDGSFPYSTNRNNYNVTTGDSSSIKDVAHHNANQRNGATETFILVESATLNKSVENVVSTESTRMVSATTASSIKEAGETNGSVPSVSSADSQPTSTYDFYQISNVSQYSFPMKQDFTSILFEASSVRQVLNNSHANEKSKFDKLRFQIRNRIKGKTNISRNIMGALKMKKNGSVISNANLQIGDRIKGKTNISRNLMGALKMKKNGSVISNANLQIGDRIKGKTNISRNLMGALKMKKNGSVISNANLQIGDRIKGKTNISRNIMGALKMKKNGSVISNANLQIGDRIKGKTNISRNIMGALKIKKNGSVISNANLQIGDRIKGKTNISRNLMGALKIKKNGSVISNANLQIGDRIKEKTNISKNIMGALKIKKNGSVISNVNLYGKTKVQKILNRMRQSTLMRSKNSSIYDKYSKLLKSIDKKQQKKHATKWNNDKFQSLDDHVEKENSEETKQYSCQHAWADTVPVDNYLLESSNKIGLPDQTAHDEANRNKISANDTGRFWVESHGLNNIEAPFNNATLEGLFNNFNLDNYLKDSGTLSHNKNDPNGPNPVQMDGLFETLINDVKASLSRKDNYTKRNHAEFETLEGQGKINYSQTLPSLSIVSANIKNDMEFSKFDKDEATFKENDLQLKPDLINTLLNFVQDESLIQMYNERKLYTNRSLLKREVEKLEEDIMRNLIQHEACSNSTSIDDVRKIIKRQITSSGVQVRGGQSCVDRIVPSYVSDPDSYHESAHCLRHSDIWYTLYKLGGSFIEHSVDVKIFEKHYVRKFVNHWSQLSKGMPTRLRSSSRHLNNQHSKCPKCPSISINYLPLESNKKGPFSLNPDAVYVLAPQHNCRLCASIQGGPGEYLLVPPDDITLEGDECNKIGVGYRAFATQPGRCAHPRGTCLDRQISDLWHLDKKAKRANRRGKYFLENFASLATDAHSVNSTTGEEYLALEYLGSYSSAVEIELDDHFYTVVKVGESAGISEVHSDATCKLHTKLGVLVTNHGLTSALYRVNLTDCPVEIAPLCTMSDTGPVAIHPQQSHVFRLSLNGDLPLERFSVSVLVTNVKQRRVASRRAHVQKLDRCFCIHHCECACTGSASGLQCTPLRVSEYHEAGFIGSLPVDSDPRGDNRNLFSSVISATKSGPWLHIFVHLSVVALLMGLAKAIVGLCCLDYVGSYGVWMLVSEEAKTLTEYKEPELQDERVVCDEIGYPVHPTYLTRSILYVSQWRQFFLNIFFYHLLLAVVLKRILLHYLLVLCNVLGCCCCQNWIQETQHDRMRGGGENYDEEEAEEYIRHAHREVLEKFYSGLEEEDLPASCGPVYSDGALDLHSYSIGAGSQHDVLSEPSKNLAI